MFIAIWSELRLLLGSAFDSAIVEPRRRWTGRGPEGVPNRHVIKPNNEWYAYLYMNYDFSWLYNVIYVYHQSLTGTDALWLASDWWASNCWELGWAHDGTCASTAHLKSMGNPWEIDPVSSPFRFVSRLGGMFSWLVHRHLMGSSIPIMGYHHRQQGTVG